ncbi:UNVERIFIED_CONTAM: hypothetical protein Scaly_0755600 [Sesamum calycinum]|uniref:Pentatricopeptide repeat-containing protein n=1 Tax=Sesamum calycinum TaxID=2727403 RepID=A0AAW2R8B9_9LAMI
MLKLDFRPDNFTYIAFISALCESGRFLEAKELFSSMEANGCLPDAYACNSFIDALIKSGRFQEAQDVWLKYKEKGITLKPMPVKSGHSSLWGVSCSPMMKQEQLKEFCSKTPTGICLSNLSVMIEWAWWFVRSIFEIFIGEGNLQNASSVGFRRTNVHVRISWILISITSQSGRRNEC